MKVSKVAQSTARRLFRLCTEDGSLDEAKFKKVVNALVKEKPRDYRGILHILRRLLRAEVASKQVTVESAEKLLVAEKKKLTDSLTAQYGSDLVFEYEVNPELIGGIRVRVGNDVLDGSVKARLERLAETF